MTTTPIIQIDIISDITCTWCILAHRTILQSLTLFLKTHPSKPSFLLSYRPYFLHLHSSLPLPPLTRAVPKAEIAKVKLAGRTEEEIKKLKAKMDALGRSMGVVFREGEVIGPTRDAHCLVHVARQREQQLQLDLYGALLSLYHEKGEDISDRDLLRKVALETGMREEDVEEAWSEETGRQVDEEEERWRGVADGRGVPVVVIEGPRGRERVDGCPDGGDLYETFVRVLEGEEAIPS